MEILLKQVTQMGFLLLQNKILRTSFVKYSIIHLEQMPAYKLSSSRKETNLSLLLLVQLTPVFCIWSKIPKIKLMIERDLSTVVTLTGWNACQCRKSNRVTLLYTLTGTKNLLNRLHYTQPVDQTRPITKFQLFKI